MDIRNAYRTVALVLSKFPISRDPPEGGTVRLSDYLDPKYFVSNF